MGKNEEIRQPQRGAFGGRLGKAFSLDDPPTLVAHTARDDHRMAVTELQFDQRPHGFTAPIPPEDAFLIGLQLRGVHYHELWVDGRAVDARPFVAGTTHFYDLARNPVAYVPEPSHPLFFYLPRAALAEQGRELGLGDTSDLRNTPGAFIDDPVIRALALSLMPVLHAERHFHQLFVDHVLLALRSHLVMTYGGTRKVRPLAACGLAPWQERAAKELMDAHAVGGTTLAQVSQVCNLDATTFVRAFTRSTGLSPHRWLQQRRMHRAIALMLETKLSIAEIALMAGFVDEEEFVRAFSHKAGMTPDAWRQMPLSSR
ncbi:helix-turn-helix domain-containing protein [Paraburkholderia saeva]|uniref:helix-turn-helix domain-containing protein n=1 Tax=Paraburkholderia saeva TaxID=2777537 RepID=UPI001DE0F600|nr:AraC family transcriptional regulator [Paraburkholderia saeva]CAG4889385.1 HTH-type transcriptional activator RhaR [Paraburkholderia saeva]CAG4894645.1 HTH-type transcriptional activator RhaR [Paraburkholderia saeva]